MKKMLLTICSLSLFASVYAQDVEYNKKKDNYVVNGVAVAKLEPKKNGFGIPRSFIVQSLDGKNLIEFLYTGATDTFGFYHDWYTVNFPTLSIECTNGDSPELNSERYFANLPVIGKMLNNDGSLNEAAVKQFINEKSFSHKAVFNRKNDSLINLISGPRTIIDRPRKNPAYADNMGRIGQGDIVIGKWESFIKPNSNPNDQSRPQRYLVIKNTAGTVLALYNSGSTEYTVFGSAKKTRSLNPGATKEFSGQESDLLILNKIASQLIYEGHL